MFLLPLRVSFIGGFAVDVVRDRHLQMKRVLALAGVPHTAYWAALLLACCALFLVPTTYAFILIVALPVQALAGVLDKEAGEQMKRVFIENKDATDK